MKAREWRRTLQKLNKFSVKAMREENRAALGLMIAACLLILLLAPGLSLVGDRWGAKAEYQLSCWVILGLLASIFLLFVTLLLRDFTKRIFGPGGYLTMTLPVPPALLAYWQIGRGGGQLWIPLNLFILNIYQDNGTLRELLLGAGLPLRPDGVLSLAWIDALFTAFQDSSPWIFILIFVPAAGIWSFGFAALLFLACCFCNLHKAAGSGLLLGLLSFAGLFAADRLARYACFCLLGLTGAAQRLPASCAVSVLEFGLGLAAAAWLLARRYNLD